MGDALYKQEKYEDALNAYKNALRLRPELNQAANNLGMLYYERGQIDSSIYYLKEAVKQGPKDAAPYQNLGLLYAELGYVDEALIELQSSMDINPSAVCAYNLAVLYSNKGKQESLKFAKIAYELESTSIKYSYTYAYYLSEQGKSKKAITVLEKIKDPDFNSYYLLSLLYKNSGMIKERQSLLKKIKRNEHLSEKEKSLLK